jgi:hypothetical protein
MNPDRQIRFLYPPVLILAFLAWAIFEDSRASAKFVSTITAVPEPLKGTISAVIGGTTAILIIGFTSGTVTFVTLRLIFLVFRRQTHEVPISDAMRTRIWHAVLPHAPLIPSRILFATAYLHFGRCPKEVTEWIARRWNAFNISANISFGIAVVMMCVGWFGVICPASFAWFYVGLSGITLFFVNALIAWNDSKGMLHFCADVPPVKS